MWDQDYTIEEMNIDANDEIVDAGDYQSEVEINQNNTYVDILEFELENTPYPSSTNQWEGFLGELDFDDIVEIADHAKPWKVISTEHLSKLLCVDMDSAQNTLNLKIIQD